jgi:hypothetical protein
MRVLRWTIYEYAIKHPTATRCQRTMETFLQNLHVVAGWSFLTRTYYAICIVFLRQIPPWSGPTGVKRHPVLRIKATPSVAQGRLWYWAVNQLVSEGNPVSGDTGFCGGTQAVAARLDSSSRNR